MCCKYTTVDQKTAICNRKLVNRNIKSNIFAQIYKLNL